MVECWCDVSFGSGLLEGRQIEVDRTAEEVTVPSIIHHIAVADVTVVYPELS